MTTQDALQFMQLAKAAGCPGEQVKLYLKAGIMLQRTQLLMAAAARSCDSHEGPLSIAVGGSRGGGKSAWMFAQLAADDCQRFSGLKCLLLRKIGKANIEHIDDVRRTLLSGVPHKFSAHNGVMSFPNGSRIVCGHYQNENDIDGYLGIEYDVVGIEEATTLSEQKYRNIRTCLRSSKQWRPRDYLTFNPGGIGHGWVKKRFYDSWKRHQEVETRFIPSRVTDNKFNNPEYIKILESLSGWQRRAWLDGDMDIAAGQFFTTWRENVHVAEKFDNKLGMTWFAGFDYGFRHWTVFLLGCVTGDGVMYIVDYYADRGKTVAEHAPKIKGLLTRHTLDLDRLEYIAAGPDVFGTQDDGTSVADSYSQYGIHLECVETDRVNGWAAILERLGDPDNGRPPTLFVHRRCARVIEDFPLMIHSETKPEDVEKVDCDDDGNGGDDFCDCARYLIGGYSSKRGATSAFAAPVGKFSGSFRGKPMGSF